MTKRIAVTLLTMTLLLSASLLLGHGIRITTKKIPPFIRINARYHGSRPLANARVTVSFIAGADKGDHQTGNTDKNGNFSFTPDKPGTWTVTVDDLSGHRGKQSVLLDNDFFAPPAAQESEKGKELTPPEKEKITPEPVRTKNQGDAESTRAGSDFCCDLLKIVLGALLILILTAIFYGWRKRKESSRDKQ